MNFNKIIFSLIILLNSAIGLSCTTILIGKDLTLSGAVIQAHNEDMGFKSTGRLWHVNATKHKKGATLKVPYLTIPQPKQTNSYWASGNAESSSGLGITGKIRPYDSVLVGMNQWGVTMSSNWMWSKEKEIAEKGIRRYAIRQLILERAKTAKQAVQLIGDFIDNHGQADWSGLDYSLSDPNESWVVETTTNHWVAKRIKDDEIWVVANRFTIQTEFDLSSKSLIPNAIKQGWYDPKKDREFNFRKAYGKPENMNHAYDIDREQRVYGLLEQKKGVIGVEDLFMVLRDRYQGTDKYTKPQDVENWRENSEENHIPRTIANNLAQSSSVALLRNNMPIEIGAVMWYAMTSPEFSGYIPVYAGAQSVPKQFDNIKSDNNASSAWWTFKNLQNQADKNYESNLLTVNNFWTANHASIISQQKALEEKVLKLLKSGNKSKALELLNKFTNAQAESTLYQANRLLDIIRI